LKNLTAVFDRFIPNSRKRRLIHLFSDIYHIMKTRIWQSSATSSATAAAAYGSAAGSSANPRKPAARNPDGIDFVGNCKISLFPQIRSRLYELVVLLYFSAAAGAPPSGVPRRTRGWSVCPRQREWVRVRARRGRQQQTERLSIGKVIPASAAKFPENRKITGNFEKYDFGFGCFILNFEISSLFIIIVS
jgi:hypothetical protein